MFGISLQSLYKYQPQELATAIPNEQDVRIRHSAQIALFKLGSALTLNHAALTFIATDLSLVNTAMLGVGLFQVALVAASIYLTTQMIFHVYQGSVSSSQNIWEVIHSCLSGKLEHLSLFSIINLIQIAGPLFWLHESGHALAAMACFLKANPKVRVFPFFRGDTEFAISNGFTFFGRFLGK